MDPASLEPAGSANLATAGDLWSTHDPGNIEEPGRDLEESCWAPVMDVRWLTPTGMSGGQPVIVPDPGRSPTTRNIDGAEGTPGLDSLGYALCQDHPNPARTGAENFVETR